jgi:opacity protein-like surface antigen
MNKINKTIILLATAASFHAPISFADAEQFYVKANAGYSKLSDAKPEDESGNKGPKLKSKGGNGFFGIGVGYNLTDKFRTDLTFDYFISPKHKMLLSDGSREAVSGKVKGNISTLTINGYFDFFQSDNMKLFTGAGLGISQTKGKLNTRGTIDEMEVFNETLTLKTNNNFTYALHLGASAKVTDNVHTDLTYSWRDFGEIKTKKHGGNFFSMPYKGHHLAIGIRYDI